MNRFALLSAAALMAVLFAATIVTSDTLWQRTGETAAAAHMTDMSYGGDTGS